ncbi:MAG: DUF1161 domain-containing protein [Candidatus Sulfotelmatobacter sp.]
MKSWMVTAALLLPCAYATAQAPARKPCEDLKAEITKKLEAKGVTSYSLDIVGKGKESTDGKIVGSCDGGTKSVVYTRSAAAESKPADTKKPQ